jgi:hypothetical protein
MHINHQFAFVFCVNSICSKKKTPIKFINDNYILERSFEMLTQPLLTLKVMKETWDQTDQKLSPR